MTVSETYYWTTILVCIGICQQSIADLVVSTRHKAIMNFKIATKPLVSKYMLPFRFIYDGYGAWIFKMGILVSGLTCIGIVFSGQNPRFLLLSMFLIHVFSYPRWRYFIGSDSPLLRAILVVLILHNFLPLNEIIAKASLLFIGLYLVLIYHLTGVQKLKSHLWRNGQAIENFLNRFPFWRKVLPGEKKPQWLLILTAWIVICIELSFFIGLFSPNVAFLFVITGLMFHGILSFSTGINHFLWTFIACYPIYIHISGNIPKILAILTDAFMKL